MVILKQKKECTAWSEFLPLMRQAGAIPPCFLDVMPELEDDNDIENRPEELKIDTFRSSEAGGQHVNKTELLSALPTCLPA